MTHSVNDHPVHKHSEAGFTLVELSIVLVIIGLIVGGVLVGQDLIRAAEVRSTVAQLESTNAAINTFRVTYNALPGDIRSNLTASFGLQTRAGTPGRGDGNGLIQGYTGTTAGLEGIGEILLIWRDLADMNLLGNSFQGTDTATAITVPGDFFPAAKLGKGNYIVAYHALGLGYMQILGLSAVSNAGAYTTFEATRPVDAFNIDSKLDDGVPSTGVIRAMSSTAADANINVVDAGVATAAADDTTCYINDTTPATYRLASTGTVCSLRMLMS